MSGYLVAIYGTLVATNVLAGLFFLRYWHLTKDRFFVWFAAAFWTFAVSWALLVHDTVEGERSAYVYSIRLLGFLEILLAIVLKNRAKDP
ncbi:MAG: DUF5985 family protein [Kofleriaceae bacterium]